MDAKTDVKTMDTVMEKAGRIGVLTDIITDLICRKDENSKDEMHFLELSEIIKEHSDAIIAMVQQVSYTAVLEHSRLRSKKAV